MTPALDVSDILVPIWRCRRKGWSCNSLSSWMKCCPGLFCKRGTCRSFFIDIPDWYEYPEIPDPIGPISEVD